MIGRLTNKIFARSAFATMFVAAGLFAAPAGAQSGGVVSSASPEATAAGVEILEAGGNAVDAAVAVAFALGVTEPAMSGLGAGTQIVIQAPESDPVAINGTTFAPAGLPMQIGPDAVRVGHTATTVPSTVRTLDTAMREFGSGAVTWADAIAPAIRYAEDGFVVGEFRAAVYRRHEDDLLSDRTATALFLIDGHAPRAGEMLVQPVLAATLRRLAEAGADDFYSGEIAREIAADMAAHGGWVTLDDLAATPEPAIVAPLASSYRGYDVYTAPPPAGGWVVLQALNILETFPQSALDTEDDERAMGLLRALRAAHETRANDPVTNLVDYADEAAERISKARANAMAAAMAHSRGGETTHFSVVDADGMAVSVTTSINSYFGARRASPNLGFLYNNYMQEFELDEPDHPFALAPRAMPYSSMSPTIVARDGAPVMAVGSPGSSRIISAVTQVVSHWVDIGAGVEAAVDAPRVHVVPDDRAYVESDDVSPELLGALSSDGFRLVRPDADLAQNDRNAYFGGVHAVAREALGWVGAADPRRDGTVGYADLRELAPADTPQRDD
ncbi:MAG: gamma-glutamyltransferase family protein [Maricaulaceae bacterium]|jgi:gamma-glutamyltranspeptidase/glutathione hydrolase